MTAVVGRALRPGKTNLRSARRIRVWQHAKIVVGAEMIHCMVRDLSAAGARLAIQQSVSLPETFDLYIAAHHLRSYRVSLRWRNADAAGVCFLSGQAGAVSVMAA